MSECEEDRMLTAERDIPIARVLSRKLPVVSEHGMEEETKQNGRFCKAGEDGLNGRRGSADIREYQGAEKRVLVEYY